MVQHSIYTPFDSFVFRTPRYPFSYLISGSDPVPSFYKELFLASPSLYREIVKAKGNYSRRQALTLYKYWSRACSRATPFGLFANCSIGSFASRTDIGWKDDTQLFRATRLDMEVICELIQSFEKSRNIRESLLFYPTDSLYTIGSKIRYIEYEKKKKARIYRIQEVESSKFLLKVLNEAKEGKTISQLVGVIECAEISSIEARAYIEELIDSQLLKSEIEPNVTGEDTLNALISKIRTIPGTEQEQNWLHTISSCLYKLNQSLDYDNKTYILIKEVLDDIPIDYDEQHLLQVDSFRIPDSATLSVSAVSNIQNAIDYLIKLHKQSAQETDLQAFTKAFISRYENEAVPLLEALDNDVGIGYPIGLKRKDSFLIRNYLVGNKNTYSGINLSVEEAIITKKIIEQTTIHKKNINEIEFNDDDLPVGIEVSYENYPKTISVLCQFGIVDSTNMAYLKSIGGNTASLYIGRFSYLDQGIRSLVDDIYKFEQELTKEDEVVAEIVHLPEPRIGNIASRSQVREHEILYLARSGIDLKNSIPVSDLYLQNRNGHLNLINKFGKKIIPFLSNAHNYSNRSTPIYRFLCDYQFNDTIPITPLKTDTLLALLGHIPRVRYRNTYLSLQKWRVDKSILSKKHPDYENGLDDILYWKYNNNIPDEVFIKEYDNELFLNLNRPICREILSDYLKKRSYLILEESLFNGNNSFVKKGDLGYCAEFIIPFRNYR